MTLKRMLEIIELNGYRLDKRPVFEQEAQPLLVERAKEYDGEFVLWDPNDDEQGYLIVGSDQDELAFEFINHFGEYLCS